jgi:hypothetical protein
MVTRSLVATGKPIKPLPLANVFLQGSQRNL